MSFPSKLSDLSRIGVRIYEPEILKTLKKYFQIKQVQCKDKLIKAVIVSPRLAKIQAREVNIHI